MNWFWYGYGERGHGLYGEVDDHYFPRVKEFIERYVPYDRLPERIPYVGHCLLDDDLWLVLGKPSGTGAFYGGIVDERQYAEHLFSPYRLVSAEPPDEPILAEIGSRLEWDRFPLPVDSMEYVQYAARLFEGLSPGERRATHHSITSSEQPVDGAFFVFARGSDNAALHEFDGEPPRREDDEIEILRKAVADLSSVVDLAGQRLAEAVTVPLLREELATFGGELERRVGDGATAAMRGELEGFEQALRRAPDSSARLERVEDALRRLSDQVEAVRTDYATGPNKAWRVVRVGAVVVVFIGLFVSLYSNLDGLKSMASDVREAVFGGDSTLSKVDTGVETVKDDVEAMKTDVAAVKAEVEAVKSEVKAVQTSVGEVKTDVAGVQGSVGEVKTDVAGVQASVGEVKTDVAGVQASVGEVKTGVAGVQGSVGEVKDGVAGVQTSVGEVKDGVTGVQTSVGEVKDGVAGVQTSVGEVKDGVAEVQKSVGEVKDDVAEVQKSVGEVKDDVAGVQTSVGEVKDDVAGVQKSVGKVEEDVAGVQKSVGKVEEDVAEVETLARENNDFAKTLKRALEEITKGLEKPGDGN